MTVDGYLAQRKIAQKEIRTLDYNLRKAYLAGEDRIKGQDGLVDYELLKTNDGKDLFTRGFMDAASPIAAAGCNAQPTGNTIHTLRQWRGYFGFTPEEFTQFIDANEDKISYQGFYETFKNYIKASQQAIAASPLSSLKVSDAPSAIEYLARDANVAPIAAKIDATKIKRRSDIAELLEEYLESGTISPRSLEGKPYLIP